MKNLIYPKINEQAYVINGVVVTSKPLLDEMIKVMTEAELHIITEKV